MIPEQQIGMAQRAVAIPTRGWRLRVEARHTCRFGTMMDSGVPLTSRTVAATEMLVAPPVRQPPDYSLTALRASIPFF